MNTYLAAEKKGDIQQNYQRFTTHYSKGETANQALKQAKASKIWIVGVLSLFFSMHSDFLLGAAAGLFGCYFYQIVSSYIQKAQAEDAMEEIERWFNKQGVVLRDKTPFFKGDEQLANPLDLHADAIYQ